jgi:hypothetical protein
MICQQCGAQRAAHTYRALSAALHRSHYHFTRGSSSWLQNRVHPGPLPLPRGRPRAHPLTCPSARRVRQELLCQDGRCKGQQYHLLLQQEQRQWTPEVAETWWLAQDAEHGHAVTVCEFALPQGGSDLLTFFRVATRAVMRRSTHPHMSALLTVFLEHGHGFFVFAHPTGESLQARIERRRLLTEQEALDGYRQLADALWFCSQQHPLLVPTNCATRLLKISS